MGSDVEENKAVVRGFYEGDFVRGITTELGRWFTDDFVDHDPPGPGPNGVEGVRRVIQMLHTAMPVRSIVIEDLLAEGDRVALRFSLRGEQLGPFPGRAERRGPMAVDVIAIVRVAGGKIAERWGRAVVS
jgi:predicted ester cyclase